MKNFKFKSLSSMQRYAATLLVFLTLFTTHAWANETNVVGVTLPTSNTYTVKINVQRDNWSDNNGWTTPTLTKAGLTFEGKQLYIGSYETSNTWIKVFQFQTYDGNTQKYSKEMWNWDNNSSNKANHFNKWVWEWDGSNSCSQYKTGSDDSQYKIYTSKLYFDASGWSETNIRVVVGHASCQKYRDMSHVDGTKLYYNNNLDSWDDAMGFGIVGGETGTGSNARVGNGTAYNQWLTDVSDKAKEYTGLRHYGLNNNGDNVCYLVVNNGKAGEKPDVNYNSNYLTYLNSTQTYYTVVKSFGGSYTSGNSKATISISSYELTGQGTTTNRTSELSTSENSETVVACRTATTRLQVGEVATGYQFDGWYTAATGGTLVSNSTDYTYYPTEAKTLYARFSEKSFSVAFANDDHGTVTTPNSTPRTVGQLTGIAINASNNTGYHFNTWTSSTGGSFTSATTASTNFYPTAATTVRATFSPNNWTITLTNHDATTAGTASIAVTYDSNSNLSGTPAITVPAKTGYAFGGYFTGENGTGAQIIDANGNVIASAGGGSTYTNASKQWIYDNNLELHAKWTPVTLTFNGSMENHETEWNQASNWTPAKVPTIEHNVIIDKPVVVNITNAVAKSVKIYNDGGDTHTGKLTIGAGMALVVAEDIQKTTDGSTYGQTTADVLHIEAGNTSDANGALVWGTSGTPGAAQVDFFTKSHGVKNSDESINQYIGTPFSNEQSILYQYYYSWIFKIKRDESTKVLSWDLMGGDESMNEFEGYNLITAYDANTTYQMEGTLVSNGNVTLNGSSTPALVWSGSGDQDEPNNENVLANSWVAPIKIKALSGFTDVESSIYIFNACNANDYPLGNYTTYSISLAEDNVIPSMQSFSVYATGENPSITLNYNTIVKSPLSSAYNNSANKAPAHNRADEMDLLKVRIDCENGWADELKIYIHEDFSNDFEDSWDAHKMYGYPEAPQLYAVTTDGNMAINCVPTADNNVLGFTPGSEDNEYTFSFTYDGDEEYYLKDTKLNIETLINTEATYTFTSEAEDSEMRFIIIKRAPAVATDAETVSGDRLAVSGVQKIMHNGQLYIIRDGEIYDATGTMVK